MKCSRLLCFLNLFYFCLCEQKLLIDQLRWDFLKIENEIWNLSANSLVYDAQMDDDRYLVKKFDDFVQKLSQIPQELLYGVEPLKKIPNFLFIHSELKTIDNIYTKFREYLKLQGTKLDKMLAMKNMVDDITNNKTGIEKSMDLVYSLAYEKADSIKNEVHKMLTNNYWCKNTEQSPQQLLYHFYHLVALNDLKSYVMQQFAYIVSALWTPDIDQTPSLTTRKKYEKRVENIIGSLRKTINQSQDIWKCDPAHFVEGKTYDEFTRLLQGHIQNEADLSSSRSCTKVCEDYPFSSSYGCYDSKSEFCKNVESCSGNIIGCFFVEAYASICVSASQYRRYDYIKYNSGAYHGESSYCNKKISMNSWSRGFVRCNYCMCLCDEQGSLSDRYISLRRVIADAKNNRVVTGIRLVKHNRILHLQIQEGKLLPYGYINQSAVHWAKLDNYKITDTGVRDRNDYFTMTYRERSMALDAIEVNDNNHVITGVRFQLLDGRIHFEIHASPFNWTTGVVDYKKGYYKHGPTSYRYKVDISSPHIPTKTTRPSEMLSGDTNRYVEFTHTDFKKDAAQTTVPFIDTQEVINKPAVPLVGAGIYYKGNSGYGGFIAPRIKTYNYAKHANASMPESRNPQKSEDVPIIKLN